MNRSVLTCLLTASIAVSTASYATTFFERSTSASTPMTSISAREASVEQSNSVKPGKSKKYKKKMSKQMKKRKRH